MTQATNAKPLLDEKGVHFAIDSTVKTLDTATQAFSVSSSCNPGMQEYVGLRFRVAGVDVTVDLSVQEAKTLYDDLGAALVRLQQVRELRIAQARQDKYEAKYQAKADAAQQGGAA